ncbi:hypothetical protein CC2G_013326 [Coprinopsis cinerea AmutBmut pab1-1]|nr:hypothetical protein CC2G_013326 [Coprinopsis cinerea AmutBmut pab1-1]
MDDYPGPEMNAYFRWGYSRCYGDGSYTTTGDDRSNNPHVWPYRMPFPEVSYEGYGLQPPTQARTRDSKKKKEGSTAKPHEQEGGKRRKKGKGKGKKALDGAESAETPVPPTSKGPDTSPKSQPKAPGGVPKLKGANADKPVGTGADALPKTKIHHGPGEVSSSAKPSRGARGGQPKGGNRGGPKGGKAAGPVKTSGKENTFKPKGGHPDGNPKSGAKAPEDRKGKGVERPPCADGKLVAQSRGPGCDPGTVHVQVDETKGKKPRARRRRNNRGQNKEVESRSAPNNQKVSRKPCSMSTTNAYFELERLNSNGILIITTCPRQIKRTRRD